MFFIPEANSSYLVLNIMRKISINSLQNTWPVLLRIVKVIKKNVKNCHNQEEPKETYKLNKIKVFVWAPRQGKSIGKTKNFN